MRRVAGTLCVLLAATVLGPLAACGPSATSSRGGAVAEPEPDRSTPEVVLVAAHRALAAGDFARLLPFLTARGREGLERDLRAWHAVLLDPVTGPRAGARIAAPVEPAAREAARRALAEGDPAGLLALLVHADPREPLPPLVPVHLAPGTDRVEATYPAREGEARRVVLLRGPDGWRIDRLQL